MMKKQHIPRYIYGGFLILLLSAGHALAYEETIYCSVQHYGTFQATHKGTNIYDYTRVNSVAFSGMGANTNDPDWTDPTNAPYVYSYANCWWDLSSLPEGVAIESATIDWITNKLYGTYSDYGDSKYWLSPCASVFRDVSYSEYVAASDLSAFYINTIYPTSYRTPKLYNPSATEPSMVTNIIVDRMSLGPFADQSTVGMSFGFYTYPPQTIDHDHPFHRKVEFEVSQLKVVYSRSPTIVGPRDLAIQGSNETFYLQWQPSLSEDNFNLNYICELATDVAFSNVIVTNTKSAYQTPTNESCRVLMHGNVPGSPEGTPYYWRVYVADIYTNGNQSVPSGYGSFKMVSSPTSTPSNVVASDGTYTNCVRITWDAVDGASGYNVYATDVGITTGQLQIGTPSTTYFDATNALPHTTNWYWVSTRNAGGESGYSAYDAGTRANNPPFVTNGSAIHVNIPEESTLNLTLSARDLDGDSVRWSIGTHPMPGEGTVTLSNTNSTNVMVEYVAPTNYSGYANFEVEVHDEYNGTGHAWVYVYVGDGNRSPILNPYGPQIYPVAADSISNDGFHVSTILTNTADPDSGDEIGIALFDRNGTIGHWQYSIDNTMNWLDVGSVSSNSALLLRNDDWLRFMPNGASTGTVTFSFLAWDEATGSHGEHMSVVARGGTNSVSINSDTASLDIVPAGSGKRLSITQPHNHAEFVQTETIVFIGHDDASPFYEPLITFSWQSSWDGYLGSGLSVTSSALAVGDHTITFTGEDAHERTFSTEIGITILVDSNGNGLHDDFENTYWPSGGSGGSEWDYDGDGHCNREEWLTGSDPTNSSSILRASSCGVSSESTRGASPSFHTITFGPVITNRQYSIHRSNDGHAYETVTNFTCDAAQSTLDVELSENPGHSLHIYRMGVGR